MQTSLVGDGMLKCKAHPFPEPQRHACMSTSGKTAAALAANTPGCSLLNLLRRKETFERIEKKKKSNTGRIIGGADIRHILESIAT